jgi:16S rRNA G966 N2-methylase RsmD
MTGTIPTRSPSRKRVCIVTDSPLFHPPFTAGGDVKQLRELASQLGDRHECARTLKNGGLLVISVPNILSLKASFGNRDWVHLDPPYHLHHFSEKGLTKLPAESYLLNKGGTIEIYAIKSGDLPG